MKMSKEEFKKFLHAIEVAQRVADTEFASDPLLNNMSDWRIVSRSLQSAVIHLGFIGDREEKLNEKGNMESPV